MRPHPALTSRSHARALALATGFLLLVTAAAPAGAIEAPVPPEPSRNEPLAEVDGQAITNVEVEKAIGAPLARLQQQLYNLKRNKLEALIADRLLEGEAARRGITVAALLQAEVDDKVPPVTNEEAVALLPKDPQRDAAREAAEVPLQRTHMRLQRLAARRAEFVRSLREAARVVVHLAPPAAVRREGPRALGPQRGAARAPVTIVEFSDFECPFCRRVQPTLQQILTRYADKVRLVYRDFPIDSAHARARPAAEAARCADDQGKFWPYHDRLYAAGTDLSSDQLRALAREVGVDMAAFEACIAARTHREEIEKDVDEGVRFGVTRTPTFFINGKPLTGAQPLDGFVRLIDEELAPPSPQTAPTKP
jgi:protein-disulfide isomerase